MPDPISESTNLTHPISDQNGQNLYPILDQKGSKTIPFGAAHTYIVYIREYPRATVESRYNQPLCNEDPVITNIFSPVTVKCMEKYPDTTKPPYSEDILPVP